MPRSPSLRSSDDTPVRSAWVSNRYSISWPSAFSATRHSASSGGTAASGSASTTVSDFLPSFFMRSEEHTSELQSLMRISYAVFCLKKKKNMQKVTISTKHRESDIQ